MLVQRIPATDTFAHIRAEYLDMPGLRLTERQAERLFRLDSAACDAALHALIDSRFLRRTADGLFVRRDMAWPS